MRPRNRYQIHSGQVGGQTNQTQTCTVFLHCWFGNEVDDVMEWLIDAHALCRKRLGLLPLGLENLGKTSEVWDGEEETQPRVGCVVEQARRLANQTVRLTSSLHLCFLSHSWHLPVSCMQG